jgi:hypothetical protein
MEPTTSSSLSCGRFVLSRRCHVGESASLYHCFNSRLLCQQISVSLSHTHSIPYIHILSLLRSFITNIKKRTFQFNIISFSYYTIYILYIYIFTLLKTHSLNTYVFLFVFFFDGFEWYEVRMCLIPHPQQTPLILTHSPISWSKYIWCCSFSHIISFDRFLFLFLFWIDECSMCYIVWEIR